MIFFPCQPHEFYQMVDFSSDTHTPTHICMCVGVCVCVCVCVCIYIHLCAASHLSVWIFHFSDTISFYSSLLLVTFEFMATSYSVGLFWYSSVYPDDNAAFYARSLCKSVVHCCMQIIPRCFRQITFFSESVFLCRFDYPFVNILL